MIMLTNHQTEKDSIAKTWLRDALGLNEPDTPFNWQNKLLENFNVGLIPRSLDIPTGLGKTAVMAIWLIARAMGSELPRRLVYVVDRRAVVDQATEVAEELRCFIEKNPNIKEALGLSRPLPISTLRGKHVDNREWLENPTLPAVIVGTVDMIGSRLFFEGYRTSRKMRPYHAGLMGADTLLVLDESHLVPPFEKLLEVIANDSKNIFGSNDEAFRSLIPKFQLMSLSATGRTKGNETFGLTEADLKPGTITRKRLDAKKLLKLVHINVDEKLPQKLADEAWSLADQGNNKIPIIIYCHKRNDAEKAKDALLKLAKEHKKEGIKKVEDYIQLFVGGRRVLEREKTLSWLKEHGFIAGNNVTLEHPAFIFATSAGEVGVDMDAQHMVSDIVHWERMVQRLGRVNRRGDSYAKVNVLLHEPKKNAIVESAEKKLNEDRTEKENKELAKYLIELESNTILAKPFDLLPKYEGGIDVSPGALRELKLSTLSVESNELAAEEILQRKKILDSATTPPPLYPALTRALVDAWSMTSLEKHTGRPNIEPWLRGWVDQEPQTSVVWRKYLPVRITGNPATPSEQNAFFQAAPPHASEILETETFRVMDWVTKRATKVISKAPNKRISDKITSDSSQLQKDDVVAFVLGRNGDVLDKFKLNEFLFDNTDKKNNKRRKDSIEQKLIGTTIVLDACFAGLNNDGLLDSTFANIPHTIDDGENWIEPIEGEPVVRFRVRDIDEPKKLGWYQRFSFATKQTEDGELESCLIIEKWRNDSATADDSSAGKYQLLEKHQNRVVVKIEEIAQKLKLPVAYAEMLSIAARLHDEGKRSELWQRAFNAPDDHIYAKTPGPINYAILDRYRHEFASFFLAKSDQDFKNLEPNLQDLALHLIAAHHGYARPIISTNGCNEAPPSVLQERAKEVALRFARLQKRWGPWGLAWWETLLRSADQQASRENEENNSETRKEEE